MCQLQGRGPRSPQDPFPSLPGHRLGLGLLFVTGSKVVLFRASQMDSVVPTCWAVVSFVLCTWAHLVGCE